MTKPDRRLGTEDRVRTAAREVSLDSVPEVIVGVSTGDTMIGLGGDYFFAGQLRALADAIDPPN